MRIRNSVLTRLLIAAAGVLLSQIPIWRLQQQSHTNAAEVAKFDVAQLPLQLDAWSGENIESDPRLFAQVGAVTMTDRRYADTTGRVVSVHLANFRMSDATLPHPPDLCYRGGGWTILQDEWQQAADGRRYRQLHVRQDGHDMLVAYWYQLDSEVVSTRDELRSVLQQYRLRRQSWPPLVKVMIQSPVVFSPGESKQTLEAVGAPIYRWVESNT